jgi:hypothetical protein
VIKLVAVVDKGVKIIEYGLPSSEEFLHELWVESFGEVVATIDIISDVSSKRELIEFSDVFD